MKQPSLNTITPRLPELPPAVSLDNGVELNVIPLQSTDIVAISILFYGGQWMQTKRLQSDFAMRQIKSGTTSLSADALSDYFDRYGATLTTGAAMSYCFMQLTCLRRTLPDVLPLFTDIITSPAYEQQKLDNEREEALIAYRLNQQKVKYVNKRLFYRSLLGTKHPAAQYPKEEDYTSINRQDLLAYHKAFITPSNAVLYVTGKVDDELVSIINNSIGQIPTNTGKQSAICSETHTADKRKTPFVFPEAPILASSEIRHEVSIDVPSVQSSLRVGKVLPNASHPDYPALYLATTILGGYFGSRFMKNIRERLGLTYGIGATFFTIPRNNVLVIATETTRENVEQCISEVKRDIDDMQRNLICDDELTNARNYLLGQFCRSTETSLSLSNLLMHQRTHGFTLDDLLKTQQQMMLLTPSDIQQCVQKYLSTDTLLITAAHGK